MMINIKQIKGLFKELQDLWTAIKTKANSTTIDSHIADKTNPHAVTKSQVGLSNVDNTPDKNKPVSTATQQELDKKANKDDLHKVATSGQYEDLENKPTIPVVPAISKVGLSGKYEDLEGTPTIPTVPILAPVATSGKYDDLEDKPAIAPIQDDEVSIAKLWSSKKVQDYVQASEAGMLTYKGQVANIAALNAITEKKVGDTYNVLGDGNGANFTWNGTAWDELGMHILVDGSPTQNSKNPVSSGGVFDELGKLLKKDGSTPMVNGYNPANPQDVATKNYADTKFKTRLTPYTDLNNYTNAGLYYIDYNADWQTINNRPNNNNSGYLEVIGATSWILQRYTVFYDTTLVYTRRLDSGSWSEWKQAPNKNDYTWLSESEFVRVYASGSLPAYSAGTVMRGQKVIHGINVGDEKGSVVDWIDVYFANVRL